jgi:hypothetical protein
MGRSARGWMTLAIDESDPGDDLPDIVVGLENFAERRHRSDDVLGTVPSENLIRWIRRRKENRIMIETDGDLLQTSARIYVGLLSFA